MAKKVEKKEKGFCGVKGLTEDMLIAAAEDLNASIGLDPAIDVEDLEGEELLEAVKTGMSEVYTADQLEDDTWKVMELLGIEAQEAPEDEPEPEEKPKAKAGKKASKKTEPEPEDDDNGDDEGAEEEAPKSKKGKKAAPAPAKGKKAAPKEEPEDDGDGDDDEPKAKKGAKAKAEPAAKKAAPKKANDGPKYSRSDAFGETLMAGKKNKKSLVQIIEDSDALYSENTGRRNNPKESAWCANLSLKALAACGYVKVDGDSVEILVRP